MTNESVKYEGDGSEDSDSTSNLPTVPTTPAAHKVTRASAAWVATAVALVLLVLLIIFILQNQTNVELKTLGVSGELPVGMAMLIAAVIGGALVGLSGGARVIQLRKQASRTQRRN